jgi:hypothetical protein
VVAPTWSERPTQLHQVIGQTPKAVVTAGEQHHTSLPGRKDNFPDLDPHGVAFVQPKGLSLILPAPHALGVIEDRPRALHVLLGDEDLFEKSESDRKALPASCFNQAELRSDLPGPI